jgi:hypothetical protein
LRPWYAKVRPRARKPEEEVRVALLYKDHAFGSLIRITGFMKEVDSAGPHFRPWYAGVLFRAHNPAGVRSGFRAQGLRFRVQGSGFKAQGSR